MGDLAWIDGLERVDFMTDESITGVGDTDFSMRCQRNAFLSGGAGHKGNLSQHEETTPLLQRTDIGYLIKQENKDVSHFTRRLLWLGSASEFMDDGRKLPATIIQQQLGNETFAFRGIGGKELESIVASDGIGGEGYRGTYITDGTLFAVDLATPLSMLDGKSYGGQDDRSNGGYVIAVRKDDVSSHADNPNATDVFKVVSKIPLEKLHAIFRVDRKQPTEEEPSFTYAISEIVPKPKIALPQVQ